MLLISVVIPFYNNANSLERALNSVYGQTYKNFEIVLVNDASPDWKFAEELILNKQYKKLAIIHHENNMNGAASRNTGIRYAKGTYIAFLDADDEWNNEHLEKSINCIESYCNSDLVFSKFLVKSNIEYVLPNCSFADNDKIGDFLFVKQQAIFTPSIFVKASIAREILFNEKLRRHQDYDFLLRFEASGFRAKLSEHTGGIIHWEDNDPIAKGGTWENSLKWVKDNRVYLTDKAYTNFIVQFIIAKLLRQGGYVTAIKILLSECKMKLITKKNLIGILYPLYRYLFSPLVGKRKLSVFLHL